MLVLFENSFLGSDHNLIYDSKTEEYYFSSENIESWNIKDLLKAFELSGVDLDLSVPLAYKKYELMIHKNIPWQKVMTKRHWQNWIENIVFNIRNNIQYVNFDYYNSVYLKISDLFKSIERIKINKEKFEKYLKKEKHPSVISQLRSFKPEQDGFCKKIEYIQDGTVSGRLTVKSGPELLILRKDLRDIITSRYENGSIFFVDYISVEPRTALFLANKPVPDDIYTDISQNLFGNNISRDIIKKFVLTTMYGGGADRISLDTNVPIDECRLYYLPKIKEYFSIPQLTKILVKECKDQNGIIKNYFGRAIKVEDASGHKLYNHKIQSSAIEITLLGFHNILRTIKDLRINPIGLIQDCLVLDVAPEHKDNILNLIKSSEDIEGIPHKMFISCKEQ